MPKYRLLTTEELHELEKEFVEYLVINGLDSDKWTELNANDPEAAAKVVALFSDVVFEGIMRKVNYLEFRAPDQLMAFQCLPDKLVLVALEAPEGSDLTNPEFYQQAMSGQVDGIRAYTTDKAYSKPREEELFAMTEKGCTISEDGALFKALCMAL